MFEDDINAPAFHVPWQPSLPFECFCFLAQPAASLNWLFPCTGEQVVWEIWKFGFCLVHGVF